MPGPDERDRRAFTGGASHAPAAIAPQRALLDAARAARVRIVHVNHATLPDHAGASRSWLEARGRATYSVEDLCLAGSSGAQVIDETNACVESTAREAFSHDYHVVYARDACASWDQGLHEATLATAGHRYATVATIEELTAVW